MGAEVMGGDLNYALLDYEKRRQNPLNTYEIIKMDVISLCPGYNECRAFFFC
jgi:hypothetical protein